MAGLFEKTLLREPRGDRRHALAIASICAGAMVVARGGKGACAPPLTTRAGAAYCPRAQAIASA